MNSELLKQYVESMDWVNPKSKLKTKLGEHLGNGRFVNFTHSDLEFELSLLENPRNGKVLGAGAQGNVFLHSCGNKSRAVKTYRNVGSDTKGTGISQFRVLRKIRQLGYHTPNVYAATQDVLVMEYLPYENLNRYMNRVDALEQVFLNNKWLEQMRDICRLIGRERMDWVLINGYIIPRDYVVDIGMIDQG